jgi:predicted ATPase
VPSDTPIHSTPSTFVDRGRELAELRARLEDARTGRRRFFLVTGEPGIGKTSLADEVARRAESSAMAVVRAGCWEGAGAPAYWPFIQVIRSALGGIEHDQGDLLKFLMRRKMYRPSRLYLNRKRCHQVR